jgi:hypothetical protein
MTEPTPLPPPVVLFCCLYAAHCREFGQHQTGIVVGRQQPNHPIKVYLTKKKRS